MPKYYPGKFEYQKDSKFESISVRNALSYIVLDQDREYTHLIHPGQGGGFVFLTSELEDGRQHAVPVMRVSLRDTQIKGYKQAHYLRIRESFATCNTTTKWYALYVERYGGVVSDREHLEGGKALWRAFTKMAESFRFKVSLVNIQTQEVLIADVAASTTDAEIWSTDSALIDAVMVMERG